MKRLHRTILLSSAYRQSGRENSRAGLVDSDNRLLWRFPRQRIEAEAIRDTILAVAGTLDRQTGGTLLTTKNFDYVTNDQSGSNERYNSLRRSIYLPVVRNNVYAFFQTFDFPDPCMMVGKRVSTVIAPQALYLMNNPLLAAQGKAFADRLEKAEPKDPSARVNLAYRLALGRPATKEEILDALELIQAHQKLIDDTLKGKPGNEATKNIGWQMFARALFASNEFVYID